MGPALLRATRRGQAPGPTQVSGKAGACRHPGPAPSLGPQPRAPRQAAPTARRQVWVVALRSAYLFKYERTLHFLPGSLEEGPPGKLQESGRLGGRAAGSLFQGGTRSLAGSTGRRALVSEKPGVPLGVPHRVPQSVPLSVRETGSGSQSVPLSVRETGSGSQTRAPRSEDVGRQSPPPQKTSNAPALPGPSSLGGDGASQLTAGCLGHNHQLGQLGLERPGPVGHCKRRSVGVRRSGPWARPGRRPHSGPDTERPGLKSAG